jgi:hypothetical protein
LYRWAHIFEDEAQSAVAFKQVRVREAATSETSDVGAIEIVARMGWVVRVTGAVDVERLRAVLEAVGSC